MVGYLDHSNIVEKLPSYSNLGFDRYQCSHEIESRELIEGRFYHSLRRDQFASLCISFSEHWGVLTATRRYPTQEYQGLQGQATAQSVSGLVEGRFGTETVC